MNELEEAWAKINEEAISRARADGRADVAEYLVLKAGNDSLRLAGVQWLFKSFLELSEEANRRGIRLEIENENPHRFAAGGATMVGSLIRFHLGLRNLTVEAGWTRAPADGFIRGGGLAVARLSHFGIGRHNADLMLVKTAAAPQWFAVEKDGARSPISSHSLRRHFEIFLGST